MKFHNCFSLKKKKIVPPDIVDIKTSQDMIVEEGANVTLICAAIGSPEPSIEWRREKGKPLLSIGTKEGMNFNTVFNLIKIKKMHLFVTPTVFSVKGSRLVLKQANRHHMGAYLCIASNGIPPTVSKRVVLIVNCNTLFSIPENYLNQKK